MVSVKFFLCLLSRTGKKNKRPVNKEEKVVTR